MIKDNWFEFFDSYIELVEVVCKDVEPLSNSDIVNMNVRIALIYNIKHAIELLIKIVDKLVNENDAQCNKTHNPQEIFNERLKTLIDNKLSQGFIFLEEKKELDQYIRQEKKEWLNGRYFQQIKDIINYYYELEFIDEEHVPTDRLNTFFRYPEDNKGVDHEVDYYKFIYSNEFDFQKILEDTRVLGLCLNSIKTILI